MGFAEKLKTIVVATDLEGKSEAALEYARKLASAYGARIVLAHGLDPMEYAAVEQVPGKILRWMPEKARAVLDEMAAELVREGIHSHSEVRQCSVVQMLQEVAQQYEAGLIVIGTKGRSGAGPLAAGAIAEELVRLSTCPVLAVAADWNGGENRPVPGGPVMLAIDHNDASNAAIEAARSLAATFNRTLIVVHSRKSAQAAAFLNPGATTLSDFGITETGDFPVRCIVKDGPPEEAIPRAVLQYGPCILVTGVKRKSDSPGPHGTAFALLARSRAPVLCIPVATITRERLPEQQLAAEIG
jgi:nucleotide-binding universal stress UspA family protein